MSDKKPFEKLKESVLNYLSHYVSQWGSAVAQWKSALLETKGSGVRASPASLCCGP